MPSAPSPRGPRWAPAALTAGLALLVAAWMVGEPPFSSPDEQSHYLRALSITSDGLIGDENPGYHSPLLTAQQLATVRQEVRTVTVGAGMLPAGLDCQILRPLESAACQLAAPDPPAEVLRVDVPTGSYPPAPYVLPGLVARLGRDRSRRTCSAARRARRWPSPSSRLRCGSRGGPSWVPRACSACSRPPRRWCCTWRAA